MNPPLNLNNKILPILLKYHMPLSSLPTILKCVPVIPLCLIILPRVFAVSLPFAPPDPFSNLIHPSRCPLRLPCMDCTRRLPWSLAFWWVWLKWSADRRSEDEENEVGILAPLPFPAGSPTISRLHSSTKGRQPSVQLPAHPWLLQA